MPKAEFETIGYWSEVKLDIIKRYAQEYSTILAAQARPKLEHVYIDGFAGAGISRSRGTERFVLGSPLNALFVDPPFREYHLIDLDGGKVASLRGLVPDRRDMYVYSGDCNRVLLEQVFPRVRYEDYKRGLCVLDPYGLQLDWQVIKQAGQMKSIELFINFPIMDINRNALRRDATRVEPSDSERMTAFWGDESWREIGYDTTANLFELPEKVDNATIAKAYRERLNSVAGFRYVPEPIPMRNKRGATIYYLFFASPKPVAADIVRYIFDLYRDRGAI